MEQAPRQPRVLKFGVFEVDLLAGELRKSGMRQKFARQPFEVLRLLLERPQEIVTREELQQHIWPKDTFVDYDLALKKAVNRVREVLGDSAESPRFIETIPRRGYRFIAPVSGNRNGGAEIQLPPTKESWSRRRMLPFVLGLGAAALFGAVLGLMPSDSWHPLIGKAAATRIQSIAVLPLQNLSADPEQEYFSDGMTDALITDLAQIGDLKVISRTSSLQYKQTRKSLPQIARELNVDGIVEGTVQRSGDRVRITAQLIHGFSDKHLWANSYERDERDLFVLEREVAGDIARQVQTRLTTEKQAKLTQLRPVNPAVLEAYLQGNSHMYRFGRGSGDEELRVASEYFQQAIDAEPNFAPAYVGLSQARNYTLQPSEEGVEIARKTAERAVELDSNLSAAWANLADFRLDYWDWSEAEQDYRRALALNRNDADAHEHLGWLFDAFGRLDEGWKEAEIAQQLDPMQDHLEPALGNRHEYDQIIQHITRMLEAHPENGWLHADLSEGYEGKGMYKEAVQQLEQTLTLFGLSESAAKLHRAYAASGYRGAMRKYAEELEHLYASNHVFVPINTAQAYTAAGDKDRAFYWLEQAYKYRGRGSGVPMVFVNRDPGLDPLRSDPRYKDLVRRLGLPP